jgi:hypothetical protein
MNGFFHMTLSDISAVITTQFLTKLGSSAPKPWKFLERIEPHGISDTGASRTYG